LGRFCRFQGFNAAPLGRRQFAEFLSDFGAHEAVGAKSRQETGCGVGTHIQAAANGFTLNR